MDIIAGTVAVGASACCCWMLCSGIGTSGGSASGGSGDNAATAARLELERLRQEVERAEQVLQPRSPSTLPPAAPPEQPPSATTPGSGTVPTWLGRTALLVGEGAMGRFAEARVLLVGLGGVGGYTAEFLVRSGVGHITIVDGDSVDPTNRNRQLIALSSTEGRPKSAVLAERLRDINPSCHVTARQEFVPADPAQVDALVASEPFDFVIDAIDSLQPKVRNRSNKQAKQTKQASLQMDRQIVADRYRDFSRDFLFVIGRQCLLATVFLVANRQGQMILICQCTYAFARWVQVELIRAALKHRVRVVSSMGAGGNFDHTATVLHAAK
jgi:tRNA A37 threonylcarbamoyladenosine dehydratase